MSAPHVYTHKDSSGMLWRFEGMRPISQLCDWVMEDEKRDDNDTVRRVRDWLNEDPVPTHLTLLPDPKPSEARDATGLNGYGDDGSGYGS